MTKELIYQIALTLVPNIGAVHARILVEHFGNAGDIFKAKRSVLERIEGIGTIRAKNIKEFTGFKRAEEEISFLEKYRIEPLFLNNEKYPKRFLNCYDPPTMFFYRGKADLNSSRLIAIVGTRSNTEYGRRVTEELIKELAPFDVIIVSGLAFGIDAIAHKAALKYNLPTIGVVGHGLDTIYPLQHKGLAKEMIGEGGIITEFMSGTKPDKHNFPLRNRVVAGISDATIVVETSVKGGSMITAEMANSYNRDVFAIPGKTTDHSSSGCNHLIKTNKAILLTDATQLVETMGWEQKAKKSSTHQRELFTELTDAEKLIIDILKQRQVVPIDELNIQSNLSSSGVAAAVLNLEINGLITSLPGKMYKLV